MFGAVEYGVPVEELFKEDKIVVIEAGNLNGANKKFILGLLATALGEYRLKGNYASPAHILVMEECHELLPQEGKGSEAEKEMGVTESVFEKLFREIREFREFIWAIGQVVSQLPAKVLANTPWQMITKLLTEEDVKKATTIISRDPQYDHRRVSRFIQRMRPGQFICRLPYGKSMAEQEPVIIKVPYIGNIPYPSDLEVHQHMQAKIQNLLDIGKKVHTSYGIFFLSKSDYENVIEICVLIKKRIGKAVVRNYYKRIVKEYIRKNIKRFNGYNRIVFIVNKIAGNKYNSLKEEFDKRLSTL